MPELPSPGEVLKVNLHWGIEGDSKAQTVHYFRYSGAAGAGDVESFAAALLSDGESSFQSLCGNYTGMVSAMVTDLESTSGVQVTGGTPWMGTRGTSLVPPGAATVVSHSIARRYRGGKPRSYLPLGISTDIATTGLWSTAFAETADGAWGGWIASLTTTYGALSVNALVNVSYYSGYEWVNRGTSGAPKWVRVPTVRATPVVDAITGHTVNRVIGTQKRRNREA